MNRLAKITVAFVISLLFLSTGAVSAEIYQVGAFKESDHLEERKELIEEWGHRPVLHHSSSGLVRVRVEIENSREKTKFEEKLSNQGISFITIGEEPPPQADQTIDTDINSILPGLRQRYRVRLSDEIQQRLSKAMGTRYVWGGESFREGGFDCSGLLVWLLKYDDMPRTVRYMWKWVEPIQKEQLQPGDFIFFSFKSTDEPDHIGLYLGNGLFVHSSSTYGVIKVRLEKNYYQHNLFGLGRPPSN